MLRLLAGLAVFLALLVPARADTYKDPDGRFDVTRPDGWSSQTLEDRKAMTFAFLHEKSEASPYDGVCMGLYMDVPGSRSFSQEDINDAVDAQLTKEFWQKTMKSTDPNFTMTLDVSGSREQSGRKIHYIVFTGSGTKDGKTESAKGMTELHFVPGSMHFVMCMTLTQYFEPALAGFDTIFKSYVPHPDILVSGNERQAPSVLTMYANANFKGVARVLSQNTANLATAGWPTQSASLTVDGAEPWQVCSGANYSGQCQAIVAAEAGAQGRPILIGSARRLSGNLGFANTAAAALRRALQQPATSKILAQ